ncbi:signal transduction histidine kinase [Chitinophaga terrae (ex Kim and Jung 2007)]|uniref:sensor histidine kinase n=1 Tax=Chitinophaga terrae (ex Kim and Jung 2007) TaxID=408074 RepID=UPI0027801D43|nr:HAMP domain-containing sensor histidine kinase [Chitinophaga terrae (ex Kim and Jung 2007)]MDQ0109607.1 signal transduction histidine kinase [Chitinophaga terrae (ex Kim and Jung 2007)]
MKLLNKVTIWFVGIVFLTTPVTMLISRHNIKKKLDQAEVERMREVNDRVARQLAAGEKPDRYTHGRPIAITTLQGPLPENKVQIVKDNYVSEDLGQKECRITVNSFYQIGDKAYEISSFNYVIKSEEIFRGMLNTVVWKILLILLGVSLTARLLSKVVFRPFHSTMKALYKFDLKQKHPLELPNTSTTEFRELNTFLRKMTDKAMEDYAAVKEFSENASHELQTPLAVIRSKLDLLSETNIDSTQAALIGDMQNAIEKLSHINRSLLLLTKLENQEFKTNESIKFCRVTKDVIAMYEDWLTLKEITLTHSLDKNIPLIIHPTLAEILISNLMSNAIRHNQEKGLIRVELTKKDFCVSNTGLPPQIPTQELFKRFKKSNQCNESIGLGLAIVKQICEVNGFAITYQYSKGWHSVRIVFDPPKKELNVTAVPELEAAEV